MFNVAKLSIEQKLHINDLFSSLQLSICRTLNVIRSVKFRTSGTGNNSTGFSYAHVYEINNKDDFADSFIDALDAVDYYSDDFKQSFLTPYFKQLIKSEIDLAILNYHDHHSAVIESIHCVFQDMVFSNTQEDKEIINFLISIYRNIFSNIRSHAIQLRNTVVKLKNPPTNIHNKYNKTLKVVNGVYKSIKNKETTYTQSFDILHKYLHLPSTFRKNVTHWFYSGILLVHSLKSLSEPSFFSVSLSHSSVNNAISCIAYSSTIMTHRYQVDKNVVEVLSHMHSLDSLNRRIFKRCLDAIDRITKDPANNGVSSDEIFQIVILALDEIIENRLAKRQLFSN